MAINYLYSQLSLKATDNSLSSSVTRNLNDTSNQHSAGDKLIDTLPTLTQLRYQCIKTQPSSNHDSNLSIPKSNGKSLSQGIPC